MSQSELLIRVVESLERCNIPYMLTGSLASSLQGEPRSTHDIDIVIDCTRADALRMMADFPPPRFYCPESLITDAVNRRSMFNLVDLDTADKVDFWMLKDNPFDHEVFKLRVTDSFGGRPVKVSAPEGTILAKLRWAKMCGGSEKQIRDAAGVYDLQGANLDQSQLTHWVAELDLETEWEQLLDRVGRQA
jgi:hypothetical protein